MTEPESAQQRVEATGVILETADPVVRSTPGGSVTLGHIGPVGGAGTPVPIYTTLHVPSAASRGLVVCSPIYAEFLQNYGREVALAQRMAARGVASARFHYRGSGDSGGNAADMTRETMVEDAMAVADHLRTAAGVDQIDVVGTRIGGHIAAAVVAAIPGARLVVWEPVPAISRYYDEVLRARRMVGVVAAGDGESGPTTQPGGESKGGGTKAADMIAQLRSEGTIDVVGYELHAALHASLADRTIRDQLGDSPGADILLVQTSRTGTIKGPVSRLAAALGEVGHTVDIESVPPGEGWWIHDYDEDRSPAGRREAERLLLDATEAWLADEDGGTSP